jgi:hypothetical protein
MFARCCSFVAILSAGTASAHQPKSRYVIIRHQGSSERSLCISPELSQNYLRACLRRWGNQWTWSGGAGFHDARHTAATVLLILGVPTATAMAIMGLVQREHGQALPASDRLHPQGRRQTGRRAAVGRRRSARGTIPATEMTTTARPVSRLPPRIGGRGVKAGGRGCFGQQLP